MPPYPWDWNDNQGFDYRHNNRNNNNSSNNNSNNMNFSAPGGPPPTRTPQRPAQTFGGPATRAVAPSSIRNCVGRYTYIWLSNGQEFWYFPIQIWGNSIAGFRWDRRFGWTYTGISLNRIDMFTCTM